MAFSRAIEPPRRKKAAGSPVRTLLQDPAGGAALHEAGVATHEQNQVEFLMAVEDYGRFSKGRNPIHSRYWKDGTGVDFNGADVNRQHVGKAIVHKFADAGALPLKPKQLNRLIEAADREGGIRPEELNRFAREVEGRMSRVHYRNLLNPRADIPGPLPRPVSKPES